MYNSETIEYRVLEHYDYLAYRKNILELLDDISNWHKIDYEKITHKEIIKYFLDNYNIQFVSFTANQPVNRLKIVPSRDLIEVDTSFSKRAAGFTMTKKQKYIVFLNQDFTKQRLIFTLLHELVHIFCHCDSEEYMKIFAQLEHDEEYPKEIIPFEDEANVGASLLYLNDYALIHCLEERVSFDQIRIRKKISAKALHNRIKNYLMFNIGMNEVEALNYLLPYRDEVFGYEAVNRLYNLIIS